MEKKDVANSNLLTKGTKLNFQVFPTLELEDENLEHLQLISSAVLSGILKNVCFYNASFLSTKFSEISFVDCNLRSSDLCSIWVNKCCFQNTDFSNATISDSTFIKCTFDEAVFESISLTKCQFIDCIFQQFRIDDSTFSLNTFTQCHIKNTHFTESFYYQIFDNCTFYNVTMDPSLLGFNFGFSPNVLTQLATKNDLQQANDDFIRKKLYINAAILRINQVQNYYDEAMLACIAALGQMIKKDILIKADEIEFLKSLTAYFQDNKQIAPISILRIWQLLNNEIINIPPNTATNKAMPLIREYSNKLYFDFINFQKELQKHINQLPKIFNITEMAELKIIYLEKPQVPLLHYLAEFSILIGSNCPMPNLVRTEKGSFHEYHEIAVAILPYLQTFFAFLGIITPIAIYKKQKQDHEKELQAQNAVTNIKEEGTEITIASKAINQSPIILPNTCVISSDTNVVTTDVIKVLASKSMEHNSGFGGYNRQNIHSITINFH